MGCCNLHLNGNQLAPDRLFHIINERDLIYNCLFISQQHLALTKCLRAILLKLFLSSFQNHKQVCGDQRSMDSRCSKERKASHSLTFLIIWVTWPLHLLSTIPRHNLLLWMEMISASKDFSSFATNKLRYHEIAYQRTFLYKYQYMVPWKLYRNEGHPVYVCLQTLK